MNRTELEQAKRESRIFGIAFGITAFLLLCSGLYGVQLDEELSKTKVMLVKCQLIGK